MTAVLDRSVAARAIPIVHNGQTYFLTRDGLIPAGLGRTTRKHLRRALRDERGAITASGMFGLTLEKMLIDGAAINLEASDMKYGMITDSATPNFDTHDFWNDLSGNEVTDGLSSYVAGGQLIAGAAVLVGSPAAGQTRWDINDPSWSSSSISNAMAGVPYADAVASDPIIALQDFVTAASTTNGTFTVQIATNGILFFDHTP